MQGIDIRHAEIGTVSSRADGSIAFRVITPELRPSEAGAVMGWHGKACRVSILPDETAVPEEMVSVDTEREIKSHSTRLRAVIFLDWKQNGQAGSFDNWYAEKMEVMINHFKSKLPQ